MSSCDMSSTAFSGKSILSQKEYAEKVPESEIRGPDGKTWFLPHHGVYHPKKANKICVVFD